MKGNVKEKTAKERLTDKVEISKQKQRNGTAY